jgi:predicted transcriptional regulator
MKSTPCEFMKWNGLPVIRREIAESMINNYGLSQKDAALKLGLTPAAVCQYVSKKRGKIKIIDEKILGEINKSAKTIIENGSNSTVIETCRICKIMREEGLFQFFCDTCE